MLGKSSNCRTERKIYKHQATLAKGQLLSRNFIQLNSTIGSIKLHRKDTKWHGIWDISIWHAHWRLYTAIMLLPRNWIIYSPVNSGISLLHSAVIKGHCSFVAPNKHIYFLFWMGNWGQRPLNHNSASIFKHFSLSNHNALQQKLLTQCPIFISKCSEVTAAILWPWKPLQCTLVN